MKMLGFIFSDRPNVNDHVDYIVRKATKKLWTLRHLKKAGMSSCDLLKVYITVIRSCLEYAVPTYNPMLSDYLRDRLEYVQKRACKIVFGWGSSYDQLIADGTIESLSTRRDRLTVNFARKASASERFKDWFQEKSYKGLNLRKEKKFEELFARTERLKNSPLYYMRRALNEK